MLAKLTSKNQITLPSAVVRELPRTEYFDVRFRGGEIILRPVEVRGRGETLRAIRAKIKRLGLTEASVEKAVRWARGRR